MTLSKPELTQAHIEKLDQVSDEDLKKDKDIMYGRLLEYKSKLTLAIVANKPGPEILDIKNRILKIENIIDLINQFQEHRKEKNDS